MVNNYIETRKIMQEIILDTVLDTLKILPFLFIAFLIIEFFEHKLSKKTETTIKKAGKFGPLIGSLLGALPQCGFSVLATNLYITRIISLGTLIAIYLSTSDEMLPILIAEKAPMNNILLLVGIKIIIGLICGFIIDLIFKKETVKENFDICEHDHCDCEHGIFKPAIKHTIKTLVFIFIITFILNIAFHYIGKENIEHIFDKTTIFTPFIASLIGLIPNCGASIVLTELYVSNILPLSSALAGLLANSGVALLILFNSNKNLKENVKIITILYSISVSVGLILKIFKI